MTLVVNLIGGPCCGKSTISAELFARLKKMNIKTELVPEYIKDKIYEENQTMVSNQLILFGMEHYKLSTKLDKVDVIVHDGALINNIIYNKEENKEFNDLIVSEYKKFWNLTFFLDRGTIDFEDYGRIHTREESIIIDEKIKNEFHKHNLDFHVIESRDAVDKIIPIILKKLGS